jgi:hypothetical protein
MTTMTTGGRKVDTAKVTDRRSLRFESFKQLWTDVERCAAAERAGRLRCTGNWTFGQILGHLASWASYPYDGYPRPMEPPWFIKLILKSRKKKYLWGEMPRGVRIPRVEGGTIGTEVVSTDEGLARLRRALERLDTAPPAAPNLIFGPLTHEEWRAINLRHAELHLGFVHP